MNSRKPDISRGNRRAFGRLSSAAAFTLVELLAVVGIIVLMGGLSVRLLDGTTGSNGPQGGAAIADSMLGTARQQAIMGRTMARLLVDTNFNTTFPGNYLHRLTVVYKGDASTVNGVYQVTPNVNGASWFQSGKWEPLPENTYVYYPALTSGGNPAQENGTVPSGSGSAGQMTFSVNGMQTTTGSYDYFEFNQSGQLTQPASPLPARAQLIVAHGSILAASKNLLLTGSNQLFGFAVFRSGRTEFFQTLASMQQLQ